MVHKFLVVAYPVIAVANMLLTNFQLSPNFMSIFGGWRVFWPNFLPEL